MLRASQTATSLQQRVAVVGIFLGLIWLVSFIGFVNDGLVHQLALVPRSFEHLMGIVTMPFVHSNWQHLSANTIPLVVLSGLLLTGSLRQFALSVAVVTILTGSMLWMVGRPGAHIGASGLVFGLLGVVLSDAVLTRRVRDVVVALAAITIFGGLLWGLLPGTTGAPQTGISWESHLLGFVAGGMASMLINRYFRIR